MKTISTIALLFCTFFFKAQSYKSDMSKLLDDAKSNFKNITGQKLSESDGIITYACKAPNVFGEMGDILMDSKSGKKAYSMRIKYGTETEKIIQDLDQLIDEKFPAPSYIVFNDIDENGNEDIAVFSGDTTPKEQKNQYLSYYIDVNPDTKAKIFELAIYGFSDNSSENY